MSARSFFAGYLFVWAWVEMMRKPYSSDPDPFGDRSNDIVFEPEEGASHNLPSMRIPQNATDPIRAYYGCPFCGGGYWLRRRDRMCFCSPCGRLWHWTNPEELLALAWQDAA